jgi:hypothetical protein
MPETEPGQRADAADRRARVVALRRKRATFDQIGRELGISKQRAHQLYSRAVAETPAREVAEWHAEELDLVDDALRDLMEITADWEVSPRTRVEAWTCARGWAEHKARMLGLNAPEKHEHRTIGEIDARLLDLADQMAAMESGDAAGLPPAP